jgi:hypothetical protein
MSSKNRGAESVESDWYATPLDATRLVMRELFGDCHVYRQLGKNFRVLEPTAGKGNIVEVIREFLPECHLTAIELDRGRYNLLAARGLCDVVACADFAQVAAPPGGYDLCIQNPPFTIAKSIIERATEQSQQTIALMRLGFLASIDRRPFWRRHPADILPLTKRPSFAASLNCIGTDKKKKKVKANGCGWALIQELTAERAKVCPLCGGRVNVTTSDSADYIWAHFHGEARPIRAL